MSFHSFLSFPAKTDDDPNVKMPEETGQQTDTAFISGCSLSGNQNKFLTNVREFR